METEESPTDGQKDVDIQLASSPEEVNSIIARSNEKEEAAKQGPASRPSARASKKIKLDLEQGSPPVLNEKLVGDHFPTTESHSVDREQLLGSVLSENEVNGPQIRSSARVFKKMKLEATAPVTPTTSMVDKKEKKDEPKSEVKKVLSKSLWSHDEKIIFFEAVNEYGRDFENIHLYINNKLKKRGASEDQMKAKDQVRQFYCRMFHEVSRHVKFSNKVKKVVQELYGIINYGELYKKLGRVSEKSCMKLSELIYRGSTVLRSKGRNVRVKTPMCRALRKLNQLDEKYEDLQLPNRVLVEIRPKDMISFLRVQSMAQNPRVRTILPLQKRLNSLLMCLDKRWKTVDAITFEKSVVSSNSITNPCIPPAKESEKNKRIFSPPLRLSPPADAKIELPSINLSDYLTRQTICLTAYESRIGLDTISDPKVMSKKKNLKQKTEVDQRCDAVPIDKALVKVEENEANSCTEAEPDVLADVVDDAVNTILSLQQKLERPDSEQSESEDIKVKVVEAKESPEVKEVPLSAEDIERIAKIRKGWVENDENILTIGEIYLMCGADFKLILEYSWDQKEIKTETDICRTHITDMENAKPGDGCDQKRKNLNHALSKLLSLAKLHYKRDIIKCSCGHICPNKNALFKNVSEETITKTKKVKTQNTFEDDTPADDAQSMYIQPKIPQAVGPVMQLQLNSIQKLKPKYCNRRVRKPLLRTKHVVVERKLPLLPNHVESGHQIVRMNIISQEPLVQCPEDSKEDAEISSIPPSPSAILKENEGEWINSEVTDYSLSSLLGHLESPVKTGASTSTNMGTDLSSEVDAHLQSLLTQSSLDFAANFADLAARVNSEAQNLYIEHKREC
ncbi:protein cramped [Cylas formicarius]|uniref:protein cramped n=1 Tax=Cylas formicarius TaxID=197179 RepID=UPI002958DDD3|nr:protein cramped [Cylas formicarius]